jgi:hypothetical protein
LKPEAGIIFEIGKELGFQEKTAYSIVIEAMNSVGLAIDYKMNTLVRGIKEQLLKRY